MDYKDFYQIKRGIWWLPISLWSYHGSNIVLELIASKLRSLDNKLLEDNNFSSFIKEHLENAASQYYLQELQD